MASSGTPQAFLRDAVLMGLAYGTVSYLVLEAVSFGNPTGSVFWPGAGLTLGVLVRRPRQTWPALLAGVFVAEVLVDLTIPVDLEVALIWAVANTVEPAVGAWLLTRGHREVTLTLVPNVVRFLALGVALGPLAGATTGATGAWITDLEPFWPTWPRWWVGDAIGVLLIAPAIIVWRGRAHRERAGAAERRWIVLCLAAVTVISLVPWPGNNWQQGLPFLIAPVLVVVALRMGAQAATLGLAATGLTVNAVTAAGIGPFAEYGTYGGLVVAQVCLAAAAFAELTVMALSHDLVSLRELGDHRTAMANALAHELKNPLAAILGSAELLEPDTPPEQTPLVRGAIERGARRISTTVDDLLALARIDDPNAARVVTPVDLTELVADAVELHRPAAERAQVDLRADLGSGTVVVTGERSELDTLVQNLISNAVKYTPASGTVTASCSRDGVEAVLTVADDGIGIAPEDQDRLFEEFFRSPDPEARTRPGTGLGLSIVQRVVERHHGSITLDSALGAGSTFTVRVPCRPPESKARQSRPVPQRALRRAWLPPRWFIVAFWHVHRALVRGTHGHRGLWPPKGDKYGVLRLTTTGRRTGQPRSVLVGYFEDGANLVTMAMNGWGAAEPAWWLNLQADPEATVQTRDGTRPVHARAATDSERERLWARWREIDKDLESYAARRPGETAVVVFESC